MTNAPILFALTADDGDKPEKDQKDQGGSSNFLLFSIPLMIAAFYFLIIVPGRKERQQRQVLWNNLKKNDEVVTSSGIIGIVANIKEKEDEVTLKIDDNARIRVLRSSIARIINQKDPAKEEPKEEAKS